MTQPTPLRTFGVMMRPTADLVAFAAIVTASACVDGVRRPAFFDECYALALVFQIFSASTAFRDRAIRGHFDPVLTRRPRLLIALAHLVVSAAPGAVVWLVVTGIDVGLVQRVPPTGVQPAAVAAFLCVSIVAWVLGLALPRYGGGILWLTLIVVLAGSGWITAVRTAGIQPSSWLQRLEVVAAFLVAPMTLLAEPVRPPAATIALVFLAALLFAAAGVAYVTRFDAVLKEPS